MNALLAILFLPALFSIATPPVVAPALAVVSAPAIVSASIARHCAENTASQPGKAEYPQPTSSTKQ